MVIGDPDSIAGLDKNPASTNQLGKIWYMDIGSYLNGFIGIIYPRPCAACGNILYRQEKVLCIRCVLDLPKTGFHADPDNEVAQIFWGRVRVEHATSYMYFYDQSRYRRILHEIKYKGWQQLGIEMGRMFGEELLPTPFGQVDLIHPVPLHPAKQKARGFNQSELIAEGMAEILQKPVETSLISRISDSGTQTHKTRYERWQNVEGIFRVVKEDMLRDRHVLLVDDVITTGATLEACASAVLLIEGTRVSIATLAYVKRYL